MHRRHLPIAEPCGNDWNEMRGTSSVRFCGACSKNVYNLSMLTAREAKAALAVRPADACVRYHVNANGDIVFYPEPAARRHALHRKALTALAISTLAACTEPSTVEKAVAPVASTAPVAIAAAPIAATPQAAQASDPPTLALAQAPIVEREPDNRCDSSWDESFKKKRSAKHLTLSEQGMLKLQGGVGSSHRKPQPTSVAGEDLNPSRQALIDVLIPASGQVSSTCEGTGKFIADFDLDGKTGKLRSIKVYGPDPAVRACIEEVLRATSFPTFRAETFNVMFPFKLRTP